METTKVKWRSIKKDGYPSREDFGPNPIVIVSLLYEQGILSTWRRIENGELRFFSDDEEKPYWVKPGSLEPIDEEGWRVTHWIPYLSEPEGD